jgi:prepilin-type N-terminal cleavage/methylation domain-containing protein/prepilin-type processing-associated H-X9-DG protein
MQARKQPGFTLIELLVVIAIIAILAAILFPVFARARENARKSTCQSNLKQMGSAFMMYYQDFDEEYPLYRFDAPGKYSSKWYYWPEVVDPYMKNKNVIHCPSSPNKPGTGSAEFNTAYGYNYHIGQPTASSSHSSTERTAARERPADTLIACDSTCYIVWCPVASPNYYYGPGVEGTGSSLPSENARYQGVADWHSEGTNILYCDGHVKWLKINKNVDRTPEKYLWGH